MIFNVAHCSAWDDSFMLYLEIGEGDDVETHKTLGDHCFIWVSWP